MNADGIRALFESHADAKYYDFHGKLTRTAYRRYGVRVPVLRKIAKDLIKNGNWRQFLEVRPIVCYEHAMVCGIIAGSVRTDEEEKKRLLTEFCSIIDDWAVCDIACSSLKCKSHSMFDFLVQLAKSEDAWTARFGIVAVMSNFIDEEHFSDVEEMLRSVKAKGYYVDMAIGWFICTAESKMQTKGLSLLRFDEISCEAKKMAVSKMRDSFRVDGNRVEEAKKIIQQMR